MSSYLTAKYGTADRARTPAPMQSAGELAGAWAQILGLAQPDTISVNADSVRGLPALERAVNLVSNSVATMMVAATEDAPEDVLRRPHPIFGAFEFYAMVTRTAMYRGNSFSLIVGESADAQLVPVHNDIVSIDESTGLPWYTIGDRVYRWDEVVHVRANATPGSYIGRGIVEKFRTPLSEQLYAQKYAEQTHSSGGIPSGVVTLDQSGPVTQTQTEAVDESWQAKFGHGQRKVAVLPKGLTFEPVSWSPHDAEFAESRRISVAEAALMADLRPEDLGASFGGNGLTYANRSDDNIQRTVDSYGPWAELVEQAFSDLVGRRVRADPDALLRMSAKQTAELETIRLTNDSLRRGITNATVAANDIEVTP